MNKNTILFLTFLLSFPAWSAEFLHPMDFDGSSEQKKQVVEFIKKKVKADYCESGIDMCQNTTLRMMEKQNLKAFKEATQVQDRKIMDRVIQDYCNDLDMCNYTTILMMYKQNHKASKESLEW